MLLTSATFDNFFATALLLSSIGAAIRILTPRFLAFSKTGASASNFLLIPGAVVTIVIVS